MTIETLRGRLPEYARDLKLNLAGVLAPASLTEQQVWGTAAASAVAARNPVLRDSPRRRGT